MSFYKVPFNQNTVTTYQTQVLDCQFQMRMVWSSEALRIHGYSYRKEKKYIYCHCDPLSLKPKNRQAAREKTYMVEESGSDVIKMSK